MQGVFYYNIEHTKGNDEDSKPYLKGTASRGGCKPGASRIWTNITSKLRLSKDSYRLDEEI